MMTNLEKVKISRIFASGVFWMATVVSYLQYRGIPLETIYQIVSVYSLAVVILEYPTGVIGDYFGHKSSVFWGYLITSLTFFLMALPGPVWFYFGIILFGAIGVSLTSGSDVALLHKVSKNFKKNLASIYSVSIIVTVVSMSIASIVGKFYPAAPAILSGIAFLGATLFIAFCKDNSKKNTNTVSSAFSSNETEGVPLEGNIFARALEGLNKTIKNPKLMSTILFASVVMMFFYSFKWFFNPLFKILGVGEEFWGLGISVLTLITAVGARIYGKIKGVRIENLVIALVVWTFLTAFTSSQFIPFFGLAWLFILRGIAETKLSIMINKEVNDRNRASILSLQNLVGRLFSAIYLFGAGFLIQKDNFFLLFIITAGLFLIFGIGMIIGNKAGDLKYKT